MIEDVEPIVDAALASLRAGLNTAIDAINALNSDFAVEHIADDSYRPGGTNKPAIVWPWVEVSAADNLLSMPSNMQVAFDRSETTMVVALWCRHVDDEMLYRSQLRYGRALKQVLVQENAFGTNTRIERARAMYRNIDTGKGEQLEACALIVTQVIVDDETP